MKIQLLVVAVSMENPRDLPLSFFGISHQVARINAVEMDDEADKYKRINFAYKNVQSIVDEINGNREAGDKLICEITTPDFQLPVITVKHEANKYNGFIDLITVTPKWIPIE